MEFDVIIIGAGLSGLAAAQQLKRLGRDVVVLEKGSRTGGVIETISADGYVVERGPNSLRGTTKFLRLVEELGIRSDLITADPNLPAYVYSRSALRPVPMGARAALTTNLLTPSAKLRLLCEPFIGQRREPGEESVGSFVRRRLGQQPLTEIVAPFVSGIYAGDTERLSMQACFPRVAAFEAEGGSIARGIVKVSRSARSGRSSKDALQRQYRLCSFSGGLETLIRALHGELQRCLWRSTTIESIATHNGNDPHHSYELRLVHDNQERVISAPNLILATPAFVSAPLVRAVNPRLAKLLEEIAYNSLISVPLGYRRAQIQRPLDGFGFLASPKAGLRVLGSIWNSSLFPTRAPAGRVLMTTFIGGTTDPEAIELSDNDLLGIVERDLQKVIGISGRAQFLPLTRYQRAIPQYEVGHSQRVCDIETEVSGIEGLWLLGNYLTGVSIGDCIERSLTVVSEVERALGQRHT